MSSTGYYRIDSWRDGIASYYTTSTQRRGVRSAVERALADYRADIVYITRVEPDGTRADIAQVTNGGFWKWQNPKHAAALRAFIEEEASK
jgi:hypothetical protein